MVGARNYSGREHCDSHCLPPDLASPRCEEAAQSRSGRSLLVDTELELAAIERFYVLYRHGYSQEVAAKIAREMYIKNGDLPVAPPATYDTMASPRQPPTARTIVRSRSDSEGDNEVSQGNSTGSLSSKARPPRGLASAVELLKRTLSRRKGSNDA